MKNMVFVLVGLGAFAAAACSQRATQPESAAAPPMSSMPTAAPTAAAGSIRATGVVSAIDPAAGTIKINHGPIAAINWPAMDMQFHAENPANLHGIVVGDHVSFELKSATETGIVTSVHAQ